MKRFFDILFSATALLVLLPVLVVVAVLGRIKLGSPGLFKQQRP
ncbi:MAG: sugar transferase, partial [Planctomycetes bacterium]|nr:sugar transferase [Planctomycetota bacterium]